MSYQIMIVVLSAPLSFLLTTFVALLQPGLRPQFVKRSLMLAALWGLPVSMLGAIAVVRHGLLESPLFGIAGLGFSVRLDPLTATMFVMIALLSVVIAKYCLNYLDGDDRQGVFLGRLAMTIASVEMLVLSGNLAILMIAWITTSLTLHKLLVFYPNRQRAVLAARKKFIVARIGDVCLFVAAGLLYFEYGTGNLEVLFTSVNSMREVGQMVFSVELSAVLIAIAAILKSAQFPTHGWLVEVMETPTPVSALLHAGILNAGPYLIVRMAYIIDGTLVAPYLLIGVGGITALFASTVLLTQPAVKVALGYSSAAHMGFMLVVCGLGVYPAAMLHLVAHSFYKAHAFLSSGSVIEAARASRVKLPSRLRNPGRVALTLLLAMFLYGVSAMVWGVDPVHDPALMAIGAFLVMGLAQLLAPALDSQGGLQGSLLASGLAVGVTTAFFSLEAGAHVILHEVLPHRQALGTGMVALTAVISISFAAVILFQIFEVNRSRSRLTRQLAIHLRNGFYANAIFDNLIGALRLSTHH
ncbi:MAG: NADH/ubiquinone/plastoquinone (complex i) [Planctomycetaceae bacterium]|nr:NADH/ubiquinone/plastoquinone (complex i) [Planctomycetaceae bacterium]